MSVSTYPFGGTIREFVSRIVSPHWIMPISVDLSTSEQRGKCNRYHDYHPMCILTLTKHPTICMIRYVTTWIYGSSICVIIQHMLDIWMDTYGETLVSQGILHRNTVRLWPRDRRQQSTGSGATWAAMDGWNGKGDATRNGSEDQPQWSHGSPEWQFDPTVFPTQVDSEFKT